MHQTVYPIDASVDGTPRLKLAVENHYSQDLDRKDSTRVNHRIPLSTSEPDLSIANDSRPTVIITNGKHWTIENSNHHKENDTDRKKQTDDGNNLIVAKSRRQLFFADETGGALVEMTYSNRTHYGKQVGPGAIQSIRKDGCCAVQ
ncbi:hypothetical protein Plhal304r1_c033g0105621 [Plasmopara halstedii]